MAPIARNHALPESISRQRSISESREERRRRLEDLRRQVEGLRRRRGHEDQARRLRPSPEDHDDDDEEETENDDHEEEEETENDDETESDEQRPIGIGEQLDEVDLYEGGGHSIFQVPRILRKLHSGTFTPHVVSIGPYHNKKRHLQEMERHKWRLLKHVVERTKVPPEVLVEAMSQLEEDTRNCYDKPIKGFAGQEFAKMMLLDACFILELLCVSFYGWEKCGYPLDPWGQFIPLGILPFIQRDLLMLENQLPLSVLDRLFSLTWGRNTPDVLVADLALEFFNSLIPGISENRLKYSRDELRGLHLLHVVRMSLKSSLSAAQGYHYNIGKGEQQDKSEVTMGEDGHEDDKKNDYEITVREEGEDKKKDNEITIREDGEEDKKKDPELIAMHSVRRLRGTGIKFEKNKGSSKLMDIEFKEGKLLIPTLQIQDSTKSIFLNLMAFEQCYPYCTNYVTSYISFLDGLINSPKDVEHLCEKGIIVHGLGSDRDVAELFNKLRKEIAFDPGNYYLSEVSCSLSQHYNQKWRSWTATLMNVYFKDPWKIISLGVAGFLIFLTAAQTVYTILSYHHA